MPGKGNQPRNSRHLLVRRETADDSGVPVAHQLHRRLAVGDETSGAARTLLCGSAEEALLERVDPDEVLELLSGLDPAGVAEVELGLGRRCSVSGEQELSANWYHQCAAGHLSPAPTAIGAKPASRELAHRVDQLVEFVRR